MYKEKLINYIDSSPLLSFVIKVDNEDVIVEFKNEDGKYVFVNTLAEKTSDNTYKHVGESYTESIDVLEEEVCKVFVEKFESMILEEYTKLKEKKDE